MEIRIGSGGDIFFYDNDGNLYDKIHNAKIEPIQKDDFKPPFHPMCRCTNIPQGMVFMPDVTKKLVARFIAECKYTKMWEN